MPPRPRQQEPPRSLLVRLAWFVGLWLAGVGAVGVVSLLIRWVLR